MYFYQKSKKKYRTRQVVHIVGEGLTELLYFSHLKKTWKYFEKDKWVKEMLVNLKMDKAFELAEKYKGRDSYSEIYKAIKKVSESL